MRDNIADRYIARYMQPHLPPIGKASYDGRGFTPDEGWIKGNPWKRIKKGEHDPEPVIDSYEKNIVPVLEEVEILLHNVNANKAIVTSDHGNYLGENGKWGHPPGQLHDAVRAVPWLETSAINQGTHEPAEYDLEDHKTDRQEQLKAMGYL